jgi:hypothetical protein
MANLPLETILQGSPLSRTVTCANCWHSFPPESVMWIAVHNRLNGEPQLDVADTASPQKRRFIPERFDVECRALDAEGAPCTQLACPRCRLQIPRASLEMPSVVLSLLGAQGSGKSVFLTSMIFSMRQEAARLGLRFQDADLNSNKLLVEDEQKMFLDPEAEKFRPINAAVVKTKLLDDARYRVSRIDGHSAMFVPPFTFLLAPAPGHPRFDEGARLSRLLCLYDNAGEHFRPGSDGADAPMTRHLAASKGLMYTFDPTKDRRVRRRLELKSTEEIGADRQDIVLFEAANRIREHAGIAQASRIPQPLVVVLTKFDVWRSLLPGLPRKTPFRAYPGTRIDAFEWDEVELVSKACHDFLWDSCREFVAAAESVSENVIYAPVAAVGWEVGTDARSGLPNFRGANCEPYGVLVPLLCLLNKSIPRVVPSLRRLVN